MATWIFLQTSFLVPWSLHKMINSLWFSKDIFFTLPLQSRSMIHEHTEIQEWQGSPGMFLSLQIGFSFVKAAVALAILERTTGLEPSSETSALKVLEACTVPRFCPFTLISLRMLFAMFVVSLAFSALISILYLVQVLSRLSTRASNSCFSSAWASMPSANCRLVIFCCLC